MLRVAIAGLALVAIEVAVAAGLTDPRFTRLVLAVLGLAGLALVFRLPLIAAIALLAFTDFLFHSTFFVLPAGPFDVRLFEIALLALLLVAILRPERRTWGGPAGAALAVFLALVGASALVGVSAGRVELSEAFSWSRAFGLLTVFFVVVRLFPSSEERRKLLLSGAIIAAATGTISALIALGWNLGDSLSGTGSQIIREEESIGGVQRVRLPGLSLGYALFWYAASQIVLQKGASRWGWTGLLAGIAVGIVVSFNRNMWLGLAAGFVLLLVLGGPMVRSRAYAALATAAGAAALILLTAGDSAPQDRLLTPVTTRAATILDPDKVTSESSYRDRELETAAAWETFKANPLLGVGAGASFGVYFNDQVDVDSYVRAPQLFLHNQYLYLLVVGGIGALIAFLAFVGLPISRVLARERHDLGLLTLAVGLMMIMLSASVAIYFSVEDMTAVIGLLTGVISAELATGARDFSPPGADHA